MREHLLLLAWMILGLCLLGLDAQAGKPSPLRIASDAFEDGKSIPRK